MSIQSRKSRDWTAPAALRNAGSGGLHAPGEGGRPAEGPVRTVARRTRRHGLAGEIDGGRTRGMTIQYIFCKGRDARTGAAPGGLVLRGIALARRCTRAPHAAGSSAACVWLGNPGNVAGRNPRKSAADQRAGWLAGGRLRFVAGNCMPACRIQHVEMGRPTEKFRRAAAPEKPPPADRTVPAASSLRPRGHCARCLGGAAGSARPGPRPLPCQLFVHVGKMRAAREHQD